MRIAIVHDWLCAYRGGERVLLALSNMFPDAPIYTLIHNKGNVPDTLSKRVFKTSFLQKIYQIHRFYKYFLPVFPLASESLIDRQYDYILSTSSAVSKSVNTKKAKHWCYIHTPMRYVWDRFDDYFGKDSRFNPILSSLLFKPMAWYLRKYDVLTANRVTTFVSNSEFVKDRVLKYYQRDSEVIYPPVDVHNFSISSHNNRDYYLFFSQLVPYKKAHQAVLACNQLKRKLVVAGMGSELNFLKRIADSRYVTFLGHISTDRRQQLYANAKALLFPGVEDFGIIPVEANATGLPVIGLKMGGLNETQTDETCQFYNNQTVDDLTQAILDFESRKFDPDKIRKQSLKFSLDNFNQKIKKSISTFLKV